MKRGIWIICFRLLFNSFLVNVPILYHLKIPENLWFSAVFREYKMGTLARNGLSLKYFFRNSKLNSLTHLYNFKNVKNTRGGVLLLVKLQVVQSQPYRHLEGVKYVQNNNKNTRTISLTSFWCFYWIKKKTRTATSHALNQVTFQNLCSPIIPKAIATKFRSRTN